MLTDAQQRALKRLERSHADAKVLTCCELGPIVAYGDPVRTRLINRDGIEIHPRNSARDALLRRLEA